MLNRIPTLAALAALAAATACTPPDAGSPASAASIATDRQQGSYALGYDFGESVRPGADAIDLDAYMAGVRDGIADTSVLAWEDRQVVLQRTIEEIRALMMSNQEDLANIALEREQALLAENAGRDGVTVLESGVQYEVLVEGDGPVASGPETRVRLHYRGTLADGTEFDASYGGDPAVFNPGGMIAGFGEALQMIPMGSTWRVWIPSALAYGPAGRGEFIGPNEVLIFEIEAIEIVE
jgi:FKBP-type peptidyl-prolyl cis-trans isomerase FklB